MALQKITINESFLGGLQPTKYGNTQIGLRKADGVDFFKDANTGNLQMGYPPTDLTGSVVTTTPQAFAASDHTTTYPSQLWVAGETKLYRIEVNSDTVTSTTLTSSGSASNIVNYKNTMYFSNTNSVNGDTVVGSFAPTEPNLATFTLSTISGLTASSQRAGYRPLRVMKNVLYIGNINAVASYDGTTTTLAALTLETGLEVTSLEQYKEYLVIGANKNIGTSGGSLRIDSHVFFWDPDTGDAFDLAKPFPEPTLLGLITIGGALYAIGTRHLYYFDGEAFRKITGVLSRYGTSLQPGVAEFQGRYTNWNDMLAWATDGVIPLFGNPVGGNPIIYTPFVPTTTGVRGISGHSNTKFYVGTSSNKLYVFKTGSDTNSSAPVRTQDIILPTPGRVKFVRIKFERLAGGDDVEVNLVNHSDDVSTEIGDITGAEIGGSRTSKMLNVNSPDIIQSFHLTFDFIAGTAQIKPGIDIFYEPVVEPYVSNFI